MLDSIAYFLVLGLNRILVFVPISASLWLGRRIGSFVFFINKDRRLVAYANLKAAFCKEKSPRELRQITKRVYQNMVQTFVEILNLTKINRKYVDRYVEVVNMPQIRNASKSGRGTILLTGHFGDWELSSLVSSVEGFPIRVLVREQKMKRLNELLNKLRESNGCKVIRKGAQVKDMIRALRDNNIVGILSDQDAGRNGMFVDFFGRQTSCHTGPMEMAKHTGSLILPNFIVRDHGPYHKLHLEEYIDFKTTDPADDIKENLQRFMKLLEKYIRKYPDQWLWLHKRWKSAPVRTVLVLNDGKAGHLNQSLAVAKAIQEARATQGYTHEDTKIAVVDVKYKNKFSRILLSACATFASWRCHGRMGCMKACLDAKSYDTLMKTYSEFVVSCGSALAPVNIFMSKENNAKNIVVMKPNVVMGLRHFKLAIIPRHDNPPRCKNVITTAMAPNLVNQETLELDREKMKGYIRLENNNMIGLLLGGDNPEFSLTKDIALKAIESLAGFCCKAGAELLVTTSRRTSSEVGAAVKETLKDNPKCKFLVIANEKNLEGTVGGILSLSKAVVVTEESVSMISEAVKSGKKVIVLKLDKKRETRAKHERIVKSLEDEGYIATAKAEELPQVLERIWNDAGAAKEVKDSEKILEAVRRLI